MAEKVLLDLTIAYRAFIINNNLLIIQSIFRIIVAILNSSTLVRWEYYSGEH